jgi:hypothetical protein
MVFVPTKQYLKIWQVLGRVKKFPASTEPEGSLPWDSTLNRLNPSTPSHPATRSPILILPSHLLVCFRTVLSLWSSPTKILYAFLVFLMRTTSPAHPTILYLIILCFDKHIHSSPTKACGYGLADGGNVSFPLCHPVQNGCLLSNGYLRSFFWYKATMKLNNITQS